MIKLSKACKQLQIGLATATDFFQKKGMDIASDLNTRIDDDTYLMLAEALAPSKVAAVKAELAAANAPKPSAEELEAQAAAEAKAKAAAEAEAKAKAEEAAKKAAEAAAQKAKAEAEEKAAKAAAEAAAKKAQEKAAKIAAEEAAKKAAEEAKAETAAETEDEKETEIFRYTEVKVDGPKVLGTIDLSSINSSTRPPKKKKKDKEKAKAAAAQPANNGNGNNGNNGNNGEKRKRERINHNHVDVNNPQVIKAANKQNKKNKKQDNKPKQQEVSDEEVQRQVKETLARLQGGKSQMGKGAKYRKEKREHVRERMEAEQEEQAEQSKVLKLTEFVTANELANMMNIPVVKVIGTCMSIGMMVSINQRLDAETINIVAEEFGYTTEYVSNEVVDAIGDDEPNNEADLESRCPIVTVMGHVDHGKTSLLDHIRNANVIAGEAGGITQHIGAYNVKLKNGQHITFLDTPGHEAFTAMRARGAKVTDLAIIIVAADDAVMPQTKEAIAHAAAAEVPIIFAINKVDKPGANPDKIKEELANMNYLVEEWGGKYQSQDISAKKGTGVFELLEKVLLEAEMLDLKANPKRRAQGSILESSLDKGRGYVANILVKEGTLHMGDVVLAGNCFGKVKAIFNERNQRIQEVKPGEPCQILGLNGAPQAGDNFNVMPTEQEARDIANRREQLQREQDLRARKHFGLEELGRRVALGDFKELNIIVKGDVDGSVEALSDSLLRLSTENIQINVIHKAVGAISDSDIMLAAASDAIICGFQVRPTATAKKLADKEQIDVRMYSIIYDAIEEIKSAMEGMLSPDVKEVVTGTLEVLQTFNISKVGTIAGVTVREGKIKRTSKVRIIRDGIVVKSGELDSLKHFKDDVKELTLNQEGGLNIKGFNDIQVGDMVEAYDEIEVAKKL